MRDDGTYNGWTNCATFCVRLSMTSNDEATSKKWRQLARDAYRRARSTENPTRSQIENARYEFATLLKEEHYKNIPLEPLGVYFDLIRSALDDVNWDEIAKKFLDE
jgi:hypothetical protein